MPNPCSGGIKHAVYSKSESKSGSVFCRLTVGLGVLRDVLRLFNNALGHSHSASGHTYCKFLDLFSISAP